MAMYTHKQLDVITAKPLAVIAKERAVPFTKGLHLLLVTKLNIQFRMPKYTVLHTCLYIS